MIEQWEITHLENRTWATLPINMTRSPGNPLQNSLCNRLGLPLEPFDVEPF